MGTFATLAAIASGVQAASQVIGGINASKQAEFEGQVYEQQAARAKEVAAENERDFRKNQSAALAEYRAAAGAGGVSLDVGSPLASFVDFAGETELQAQRIRKGGETNVTRLQQQAALSRMAGNNALIGGLGRAGSTLLTGYANYKANKPINMNQKLAYD